MSLKYTRALLDSALAGVFDNMELEVQPILKLRMPTSCPNVPDEILNPRETWDDVNAYDKQAEELRDMFRANYLESGFADLGIEEVM